MRLLDLFRPRARRMPRTVSGLALHMTRRDAGVALAHHQAHQGDPSYRPALFGLRAAERAIRWRGWDRDAVLREGAARLGEVDELLSTQIAARDTDPGPSADDAAPTAP